MNDRLSHPLTLNNVSHHYGNTSVLQELSFTVKEGEFVVVVGPSGCGKTTLLSFLSGHATPFAGSVTRQGVIRAVYQHDSLFPWLTVSENISMGLNNLSLQDAKQDLGELIELISLSGFEDHYPHQLSGGMRQRVELARVLAGESDILLMDEPFSSLDYQTRLKMRRELIRLLAKRPRTVVFVTHDIEEAVLLADRIVVLSHRPTSVCRELCIDAPHPRTLAHPSVLDAMNSVMDELGLNASYDSDVSVFEEVAI